MVCCRAPVHVSLGVCPYCWCGVLQSACACEPGCLSVLLVWCAAERPCEEPPRQVHGHQDADRCTQLFAYKKTCQFECDDGYQLPPGESSLLTCVISPLGVTGNMHWDKTPPDCRGTRRSIHSLDAQFCSKMTASLLATENV